MILEFFWNLYGYRMNATVVGCSQQLLVWSANGRVQASSY